MTDKSQTLESILTTCRSIIGILKDTEIPAETGDKAVGQLLAHLDLLIAEYDAPTEDEQA